jgi:ppGpp synthetase/RelA/SpoT-type nucleotidyltranferase
MRAGPLTLVDLLQLRRFLETLEPFAEESFAKIRDLDAEAAGLRPAQITRRNVKTIRSILAKLRRQSTTLRQIQDLVGCRVVVHDIIDRNKWLTALASIFTVAQIADRRPSPQHGYRAVHFIIREGPLRFEVQLRTLLQDRWANVVEKLDDRLGTELKYGAGNRLILDELQELSTVNHKIRTYRREHPGDAATAAATSNQTRSFLEASRRRTSLEQHRARPWHHCLARHRR